MKEVVVVFLVGLAVGVAVVGILGVKVLRQIAFAKAEVTALLERVARAAEKR
ncbi:MAG TPA: hypothetical protein VJV74_13510 [Terriglobia bacterium]|nr:hypothetical protein [Terriglobia bacterium]